eukprot:TRINITY_DN439_c2_g1_i1.p1 TRINITY_DN439_c2_g1~~TRINITY_DN439_c2_g1_i1.p1  ORF type:complete len:1420 (+),score=378.26 TRINITY_DN439_c2_g1_i1:108-4367(+)
MLAMWGRCAAVTVLAAVAGAFEFPDACQQRVVTGGKQGVIEYPAGGGNYEDRRVDCWQVTCGESVPPVASIRFSRFDTETNYDFVSVTRVQNESDAQEELMRRSGAVAPQDFFVAEADDSLLVVFTSDGSVTRTGFTALWQCTFEPPTLAPETPAPPTLAPTPAPETPVPPTEVPTPIPAPALELLLGGRLNRGQTLLAGNFTFVLDAESGNLVLSVLGTEILRLPGTGDYALFGEDGDFGLYTNEGTRVWHAETALAGDRSGERFVLTEEGQLEIQTPSGAVRWTAGILVDVTKTNAAEHGVWGALLPWNVIPIHSILLPGYDVLTFGTDRFGVQKGYDLDVFYLETNNNSFYEDGRTMNVDTFCSAPIVDPHTGNVVLAGGDNRVRANVGIDDVLGFNSVTHEVTHLTAMRYPRWYGTITALPSGELFAYSGKSEREGKISSIPEVYSSTSNEWREVTSVDDPYQQEPLDTPWWYPRNYIAPNGKVFGITGRSLYFIDPDANGRGELLKLPDLENYTERSSRYTSTAVMYKPGWVLQVGGPDGEGIVDNRATNKGIVIEVKDDYAIVTDAQPMAYARGWATAQVLPTGDVVVVGGSAGKLNSLEQVTSHAELWDPDTGLWTTLSFGKSPRLYHSTVLLLPNATLLVGGGGAPGPLINNNVELFTPPYLIDSHGQVLKGNARPMIINAPLLQARYSYGATVLLEVSGVPHGVKKVTLLKTGSMTHSFDMDQRCVELEVVNAQRRGSGALVKVRLPASPNTAPPGYYMIFVVSAGGKGVPSEGHIVKLHSPNELRVGESLEVGQRLVSEDGRFTLSMGWNGVLALSTRGTNIWEQGRGTSPGVKAMLEKKGNFVLYAEREVRGNGKPKRRWPVVWEAGTRSRRRARVERLVLENTGNLVMYTEEKDLVWESGTMVIRGNQDMNHTVGSARGASWVVGRTTSGVVASGVVAPLPAAALWIGFYFSSRESAFRQVKFQVTVSAYDASTGELLASADARVTEPNKIVDLEVDQTGRADRVVELRVASEGVGTFELHQIVVGLAASKPDRAELLVGQAMGNGARLTSENGKFSLTLHEGELVLTSRGTAVWRQSSGSNKATAALQADGNFVLVPSGGNATWESGSSSGEPADRLVLEKDGNLVVYSTSNAVLWSSNVLMLRGHQDMRHAVGSPRGSAGWGVDESDSGYVAVSGPHSGLPFAKMSAMFEVTSRARCLNVTVDVYDTVRQEVLGSWTTNGTAECIRAEKLRSRGRSLRQHKREEEEVVVVHFDLSLPPVTSAPTTATVAPETAEPAPTPVPSWNCTSWRQTGGCVGNGPREPSNDKSCTTDITRFASGFCECSGGDVLFNCGQAPVFVFTCAEVCLEPWKFPPPPAPTSTPAPVPTPPPRFVEFRVSAHGGSAFTLRQLAVAEQSATPEEFYPDM